MQSTRAEIPRRPSGRRFATVFGICILVIIGVIAFGFIARSSGYTAAETHLVLAIANSRIAGLVDVALAFNWLFSPPIAAVIGVVVTLGVYLASRKWLTVLHFVLLVAGTWLGSEVVKLIVHRPRPVATLADTLVPNPDPDSYPSGHVCFAFALGFALLVIAARSRARVVIAVGAVILALITSATRVYLGVHFPTDVVASLVYSAAAFVAIEVLWRRYSVAIFRTGGASGPARGRSHSRT
jgi:membrane-associated phospholipid phosphatase